MCVTLEPSFSFAVKSQIYLPVWAKWKNYTSKAKLFFSPFRQESFLTPIVSLVLSAISETHPLQVSWRSSAWSSVLTPQRRNKSNGLNPTNLLSTIGPLLYSCVFPRVPRHRGADFQGIWDLLEEREIAIAWAANRNVVSKLITFNSVKMKIPTANE